MSDKLLSNLLSVAYDRAREVVGQSVWAKLSERVQAGAIDDEMRALGVEPTPGAARLFCVSFETSGDRGT